MDARLLAIIASLKEGGPMKRAIALALFLAGPASADVTVRYRSSSGGFRGMGAFESQGTRSISDLKSREESTVKFTGAILGRVAGKKGGVQIVRVDLGKR